MGASTANKDKGGSRDDSQTGKFTGGTQTGASDPDVAKKIAKKVKKKLGLTAVGGLGGENQGMVASNLTGKDKLMYGKEASQMTNVELVNAGLATQGNPYYDHKGNITGYSYHLTSKGQEVKYGKSGGAMGSGDPSGAMSSVPISQQMLKSQNKLKGLALGALSLVAPSPVSTVLRLDAAKSLKDAATSGKATTEYMQQFEAKQKGKKPPKKSNIITDTLGGISKFKATLGGN